MHRREARNEKGREGEKVEKGRKCKRREGKSVRKEMKW